MTIHYTTILKIEISSKRSPFVWNFKSESSGQYAMRKMIFILYQKSSFLLMKAEMRKPELVDLLPEDADCLGTIVALLPHFCSAMRC